MMIFGKQVADSQHGRYRPVQDAECGQRPESRVIGKTLRFWQPDSAQGLWQRDSDGVPAEHLGRCPLARMSR